MHKAENVVVRLDKEPQSITENKDSNSRDRIGERNKNIESFFGTAVKNKLHQLTAQVNTKTLFSFQRHTS
jgi:hypothetical protein